MKPGGSILKLSPEEYKVLEQFLALLDIYGESWINDELLALASKQHIEMPRMLKWSEEDLKILKDRYESDGTMIPELRAKFTVNQIINRAANLGLKNQRGASKRLPWTEQNIRTLKELYPICGTDIPELLKYFSRKQIMHEAYHLGIRMQAEWSEDELSILRKEYPLCGKYIPELMRTHSLSAIEHRAWKEHLTFGAKMLWSSRRTEILKEKYPEHGTNIPELLEVFSVHQISSRAAALGLRRTGSAPRSHNEYTDGELELLKKEYPRYGTDIPELLKRHSPQAITAKANSLGLHVEDRRQSVY